ncbi:MAG TPA: hypothetical protein VKW06_02175 [Candidatus Angelobacter sp.]|nr:hypothetical protein [Candidatus Angelobacter sp.]
MTRFPSNKTFAFSIFDDTDNSTLANIRPVYRMLRELGFRTTKSVWPLAVAPGARFGGDTLQDCEYLRFIQELQHDGFEIGLHNVRSGSSPREIVHRGLEEFRVRLGEYPRTHANHCDNFENIYWGSGRLSRTSTRFAYNLGTRYRHNWNFRGHVPGSEYFWGDLCRNHIRFVRNFVFDEVNLERVNPTLPYHDESKPFVNYWFSSCEGGDVSKFCDTLSEENQDRLVAESGICIMYTHFASGFAWRGMPDPGFTRLMRRLSRLNGWFVPVSELLEFLVKEKKERKIRAGELASMETRWLRYKLRVGRG